MCSVNIASTATIETTKLLFQDLFSNYSKHVLPVIDQSKPVSVNMDLSVVSINDFDEVTGTLTIVAILNVSWNDESLVWDSVLYGNTTTLTFNQDLIWLPEMVLLNPADSVEPIGNARFKVTVTSTGGVVWATGGLLKAACTADVSRFPFDQQNCTISISPWGYSSSQVTLTVPSRTIDFGFYCVNGEWDVTGSRTMQLSNTFDIAKYTITIKRRHTSFLVSVVIPIIMLAFVNPFVFILPFDSGERVSYSITVLLAFSVYMTVVSDRMPASSQPMSILAYYLLFTLSISVLIVIVNIFQIRTYGKDNAHQPIPQCISRTVLFLQMIYRSKKIETKRNHLFPQENGDIKAGKDVSGENNLQLEDLGGSPISSGEPLHENAVQKGEIKATSDQQGCTWYKVAKMADVVYFGLFSFVTVVVTFVFFIITT
ncbi:neuronal acetylcholine receptor subunit alpha-9-like [Mizuhopecten yessoensis]|nr:neuronal acetylcholine receptor subunit alpha-9-like [Mizuhopecten yessoensis]